MNKRLAITLILPLLLVSASAFAAGPLATAEATVNRVMEVLSDPEFKNPAAKEAMKQKFRVIYREMVDEVEFSRRTLARNWNKLTPAQRREFVELYEQLLEQTYIDKVFDYTNEKIVFYNEHKLSDTQAEVQSKIVTASAEIPIFYRMILKDGQWKVYDVVVENVSLVQNYRTQFNEILANNTPEQLLVILRKRVKES